MSEQKLDLILQKLEEFGARQQSQEDHIKQLIQIVGATNAKLEENTARLDELTNEVREIKTNQQEHQKVLSRLALRSISQEEDITVLQRMIP